MAAGNAIASGAVILTANADGLANGLQRSQGQVIDWGNKSAVEATKATEKIGKQVEQGFEHTQSKLNKAFGKFAKHEGGFLGMIGGGVVQDLGLGGTAAIVTGVVLAAIQLGPVIRDWAIETEKFNSALDDTKKRMERLAGELAERATKTQEWLPTFSDSADKVAFIEKQMEPLVLKREALVKDLARLNAASHESWFHKGHFKEMAEEASKAIDKIDEALKPLREQRLRIEQPSLDPAFVAGITKATDAVREQIETWGLDAVAAQRAIFVMHGAFDEMLKNLDAANKKAKELAAGNSLQPWAMGMLGLLDPIAERLGQLFKPQDAPPWMAMALHTLEQVGNETDRIMGKYQQVYEPMLGTMLRILGATAQGITAGASFDLSKMIDHNKIAEPTKFAGAALKGSLESYTLEVKNQYRDMGQTEASKTTDAVKSLKDPLEKAVDRLDQINKQLGDWEVV